MQLASSTMKQEQKLNNALLCTFTAQYALNMYVNVRFSRTNQQITQNALLLLQPCVSVCGRKHQEWPKFIVLGVQMPWTRLLHDWHTLCS